MFCENCGTRLDDNARVCPACGTAVEVEEVEVTESVAPTQSVAAVTSATVEIPQPVMETYQENNNKGGFPKKLFTGIAVAIVAVVVVAAGAAFAGPAVMRALAPEKAYRNAEKKYLEKMVEDALVSYDNGVDKLVNYKNSGTELEATISLGESAVELIDEYAKVELDPKTSVGVQFGVNKDNSNYLLKGALLWGSKALLSPEIVIDSEEEAVYATIPELDKNTLAFDMGDIDMDGFADMTTELEEVMERLSKAYPKSSTLQSMVSSYIDAALDAIEDDMIEHSKTELRIGGAKQKCTEYTITMTGEEFAQVGIAFLEAMQEDERVEELIVEFFDAVDEKDLDGGDIYDALDEEIKYLIDYLEEFEEDLEIEMIVYMGSDGDIYGREINVVYSYYNDWYEETFEEEYYISMLAPESGKNWGFELVAGEVDDDGEETYFEIYGEGTLSGDKRSGTLELVVEDESILELQLKDFCAENLLRGEISGTIVYAIGADIAEAIDAMNETYDAYGYGYSYAMVSVPGWLTLLDEYTDLDIETAELQIELNGTLDKLSAKISLAVEEQEFFSVAASAATTSGESVKAPSKALEITDEEDLMDWFEEIAFDEVLEQFEKKGLPEDLVDMLDGLVELYLD